MLQGTARWDGAQVHPGLPEENGGRRPVGQDSNCLQGNDKNTLNLSHTSHHTTLARTHSSSQHFLSLLCTLSSRGQPRAPLLSGHARLLATQTQPSVQKGISQSVSRFIQLSHTHFFGGHTPAQQCASKLVVAGRPPALRHVRCLWLSVIVESRQRCVVQHPRVFATGLCCLSILSRDCTT